MIDLASNTILAKTTTGNNGYYKFKVSADRNYGIIADKPGYLSASENIDIRPATLADTMYRNIFLTAIQAGAMIRMNCIFFEFAKANLLEASKNELNRIADFLSLHKSITIEIHGHTDSIGTGTNNMILANKRADAVRNYFIKQGIALQRLSIKAFGETRPVSTNSTEEGRQLNRRVELRINNL